jgi:hypothetical protein
MAFAQKIYRFLQKTSRFLRKIGRFYEECGIMSQKTDWMPGKRTEQLIKSFCSRRKKDVVMFDYEDSGKTAYITVQVEDNGKKGPWGPMMSAIIP